MTKPSTPVSSETIHQSRPLVDLLVSIIIPSLVLMKLSGEEALGATLALVVALSFPLAWGLFELIKYKKFNFIALLGLVSVLLTGGIGLLKLDTQWLAIKEAAIPAVIGIAVLVSTLTRSPLIKMLIYNPKIMDVEVIKQKLIERENTKAFESRLLIATYMLGGTFFFSAVMNYILAKWIVTSPSGSSAFNEELGQLTLYSYPMIAVPSMIMMMLIFYFLWRSINNMTGLTMNEVLRIKD